MTQGRGAPGDSIAGPARRRDPRRTTAGRRPTRRGIAAFGAGWVLAACLATAAAAEPPCDPASAASGRAPALDLESTAGGLALVDSLSYRQAGADREFVFTQARPVAPARVDPAPAEPLRLRATPARWGSRLVSERLPEVEVSVLAGAMLEGSIVTGRDAVLGGVLRLPGGATHARTAFLVQGSPHEHLAALEYLYALVLREDTEGRFRLRTFDRCRVVLDTLVLTQSDLLHELGRRRNRVAAALAGASATPAPWRLVSLRPASADRPLQAREVRALVTDPAGPLAGAAVVFSRAPHSGCSTTSDAHGIAHCVLQDSHGDLDDDDAAGPVVATFTGALEAGRVAPPMASVVAE